MNDRTDLGELSDSGAVTRLLPVAGLKLVDIGCGAGANARTFAMLGAEVTGIEPDPVQAEANRQAPATPRLFLLEGRAESLPLADGSQDGALFFRSLHHVPEDNMDTALHEAARVLKPGSGTLIAIEPAARGSHFALMQPFHDETAVRAAAQQALGRLSAGGWFASHQRYSFTIHVDYADFDELIARITGATFNHIQREMVDTAEVRTRFRAGQGAEGYRFRQPMLLDWFSGRRG